MENRLKNSAINKKNLENKIRLYKIVVKDKWQMLKMGFHQDIIDEFGKVASTNSENCYKKN